MFFNIELPKKFLILIAMNKKQLFFVAFLLCSLFTSFHNYSQTTLSEGDIAIIGIDTSAEDFMFVTFVPLSAGTQIYFTDESAVGTYFIGEGEGTVLYTAPMGGVEAGSVISYKTNALDFSITTDGAIELADAGDGIIAYQGTSVGSVTTFLHAIGKSLSEIGTFPNGFSNYVVIGGVNGEYYNIRSGATASTYLTNINNSANWSTSGESSLPFNLSPFSFETQTTNNCANPFISEYVEGSSYNKYIEIFNPTNSPILLTDNYFVQIYSNGSNSYTKIALIGTIAPFDTFVIAHNKAVLLGSVQQKSSSLDFNGNDAVALANTINIIDLIGSIEDDSNFANDIGLKRKSNINNSTVNYDTSEWDILIKDDVSNLREHLSDCGLVCPLENATTWNGFSWSNGSPNTNTTAILNADYNTFTNGNFTSCSLIVNANVLLTIANSTYLEIENNVFTNGTILVENQGSFVQNTSSQIFKLNSTGNAIVQKTTAPINAWYEYTYWSSPVANETIETALAGAPSNRRFWFNAQNYLDKTAETGNNNVTIAGQDDIDDDGNDWQTCIATATMIPGVGYAATQSSATFTGLGSQYNYTFTGKFNNGTIAVPVYRNDCELLDTNWNFIGNPYPCAIDVDAFFNENVYDLNANGTLEGAIYLWSQNTAPSSSANGNEQSNFSQSDYAIINGIGATAAQYSGGKSVIPNRFIPSCQGFFVALNNNANVTEVAGTIKKGAVIFNNSMRVVANNDQFFKTTQKSKSNTNYNKIWLDLTAGNGVFSQILVGYVNGASNRLDNSFFDAVRNISSGNAINFYSFAEENSKKLAIQGKAASTLTVDEKIQLGIETTLPNSTKYNIAIAKIEGDFLSKNNIYLEDNLLGITHNLSESNYEFCLETGTFNNRFNLVFSQKTLSISNEEISDTNLSIIQLENGTFKISVNPNTSISTIEIIDTAGRILTTKQGCTSNEIYEFSTINTPVFLARVTTLNGQKLTKKAIDKRY
ncbi:hypothetical protein EC396_00735 [Lutibacter sp. HS1-25]|nr:hypothetical protein EC396_00735 [Lutibacter sp. HS1-25]